LNQDEISSQLQSDIRVDPIREILVYIRSVEIGILGFIRQILDDLEQYNPSTS
jgi:hypothetical protein